MAFHYRTICCSRECAKIYLARVLEARGQLQNSISVVQDNTEQETPESPNEETEQVKHTTEYSDTLLTEENEETATVVTRKRRRSTKNTEDATTEQINEQACKTVSCRYCLICLFFFEYYLEEFIFYLKAKNLNKISKSLYQITAGIND